MGRLEAAWQVSSSNKSGGNFGQTVARIPPKGKGRTLGKIEAHDAQVGMHLSQSEEKGGKIEWVEAHKA